MIQKKYIISAIIFLIFILFIIVLILLNKNGQMNEDLIECVSDNDCIKVKTTCCPCQMGGIEKCIPSQLIREYQETLNACPPEGSLMCLAMYNCQISNCLCIKGRCTEN